MKWAIMAGFSRLPDIENCFIEKKNCDAKEPHIGERFVTFGKMTSPHPGFELTRGIYNPPAVPLFFPL